MWMDYKHVCLCACVQGVWGVSQKEEEAEEATRAQFVEENVSSLDSQFAILYDLFKVGAREPSNY